MADYYPLIARAISGLEPGAPGEARRTLYERARTALIAQLRGVQPPLTETEITRERLALEEAIRKVESEAAKRVRMDAPKSDSLTRSRPGDALRSSVRSRAAPYDSNAYSRDRIVRSEHPSVSGDESPRREASRYEAARSDRRSEQSYDTLRPQSSPVGMQDRRTSRSRDTAQDRWSKIDRQADRSQDMRDFHDDPSHITAPANHSGRRGDANAPLSSLEFDHAESRIGSRLDPMAEAAYSYDEAIGQGEDYRDRPPVGRKKRARSSAPARRAKLPRASSRFPLKSAIILALMLAFVGGGILVGPKLMPAMRGIFKSQPVTEASKAPVMDNGVKPKITDRVGQPSSSGQIAPVAQKVVLYDEDPTEPQGKQYVGSVVWRTEQVASAAGQPPDLAIRADIEVPERMLKMTLSIRRNNDASLPASHTAELTFTLPPNFKGSGIANVPGVLMKSNEQARGTPLAGLAVKVTDGFFLVGLSNVEADKSRNVQLLKERSWFDIPLIYTNQRRAILAIEKGAPGERAFNDVFTAWGS